MMEMDEIAEQLESILPAPTRNGDQLSWSDYEYEFFEKEPSWFWIFGSIAFLLVLIAFLLKDFLLVIIIILAAYVLATYSRKEPKLINYEINSKGLVVGHNFYPFTSTNSFWVDTTKGRLTIESQRFFKPHITFSLNNVNPSIVRAELLKHLPEKRYQETFSDLVTDLFGF